MIVTWQTAGTGVLDWGHQGHHPECMTAREEILEAIPAVTRSDGSFTVEAIVRELRRRGSRYAESTIRTHVVSRMCANSPGNHAVTYDDLERLEPGIYRPR